MIRYAWLIPSLPAVSFFLIVFFGRRMPRRGPEIGIAAVFGSFVVSLVILWHFVTGGAPVSSSLNFLDAGSFFKIEVGQNVDGLAAVMFVVVTLVSLLVQIYSTAYMEGDRRYTWYFAALSLFTASMLNLVIADNLFQLLVGWELVGICSYLLIGHWWEEKENSDAAIKAFIATKTGDIPFMFGIFVLTIAAKTANIPQITHLAETHQLATGTLTVAALLLLGGAIGKSAQFPLHVWLPDAMAGPTPVSALIHAATMVAAGVYLVGRLFAVFAASGHALAFVGTIGSITMLIAALLAMVQDDIKRVLAYSTVSQLAYMVAALGLSEEGYAPGLFHLLRLLQGPAVPRRRVGHPRGSLEQHERDGGIEEVHAGHVLDVRHRFGGPIGDPAAGGVLVEGRDHHGGIQDRPLPDLRGCSGHGDLHRLLHDPGHPADLLRRIPRDGPPARVPVDDDGPPDDPGRALRGRGLPGPNRHLLRLGPLRHSRPQASRLRVRRGLHPRRPRRDRRRIPPVCAVAQRILDGLVNGAGWLTRRLGIGVDVIDRRAVDGAVNGVGFSTRWSGGFLKYAQSGNVQRYAIALFGGVIVLAVLITVIR